MSVEGSGGVLLVNWLGRSLLLCACLQSRLFSTSPGFTITKSRVVGPRCGVGGVRGARKGHWSFTVL